MAVPWQAFLVVAVLAVAFTGGAGYRLVRERVLRRSGVRVRALVVAHDEHFSVGDGGIGARNRSTDPGRPTSTPWSVSTGGDRGLVSAPIVQFTTLDGRTVRARSPVSSNMPTAVPGRVMTVHYNPDNPEEVAIHGHGLGTYRVFLAIGLLLCAVTVALLFASEEALTTAAPVFVPIVLGTAFLGIGGYGVGRIWVIRMRGGRADGVVVGETKTSTREGMPMYHPVVSFRTAEGFEIQSASERGRTLRRVHQGQAVQVRYHPDDPYRIVLAGDGARPLFYLFAIIGLLLLGGTATVLLLIASR